MVFCVVVDVVVKVIKIRVSVDRNLFFILMNIGCEVVMVKGYGFFGYNNFIFKFLVRKGV